MNTLLIELLFFNIHTNLDKINLNTPKNIKLVNQISVRKLICMSLHLNISIQIQIPTSRNNIFINIKYYDKKLIIKNYVKDNNISFR